MHQIGIGVLGPVFRTYEPSRGGVVAVKAFHLDITPEQARVLIESLERFVEAGFSGPGVVSPIAVGLEQDVPYLAQEYVAAESLETAIRHYAPATLESALPLISQIAAALDSVHGQGVIHGAIHLRDIFAAPDDLRVNGFGLVQTLEALGLPAQIRRPYTAPEIIAGREWDGAADRFSLAAIAYELLTGRRIAGTGEQMSDGIRSIDGLSDLDYVEEVFSVALADDPESRYSSAMGFVAALEMGVTVERDDMVAEDPEDRDATGTLDLLAGVEFQRQSSSGITAESVNRVESSHHEDEVLKGQIAESSDGSDLIVDAASGFDEDLKAGHSINDGSTRATEDPDGPVGRHGASSIRDKEDHAEIEGFESALDHVVESSQDSNTISTGPERQRGGGFEVGSDSNVGDQRHMWEDSDVDNDDGGYVTPAEVYGLTATESVAAGSLPAPEVSEPRRTWNWALLLVLVGTVVVGGLSYFLGVAFSPNEAEIDERTSLESGFFEAVEQDAIGRTRGNSAPSAFGGVETGRTSDQSEAVLDDDPISVTPPIALSADQTMSSAGPRQADPNLPNSLGLDRSNNRTERLSEPQTGDMFSVPSELAVVSEDLLTGRVTALETGWILVRTDIPGAIVAVDGRLRGRSPLSLGGISFGSYHVEVSRPGFRPVERDIQVSDKNAVFALGVTLVPSTSVSFENVNTLELGSLSVRSRPSGVQVTVNGARVGVTPVNLPLPVGRYEIRIEDPGYRMWGTNIEISSGRRTQVNASLERGNR